MVDSLEVIVARIDERQKQMHDDLLKHMKQEDDERKETDKKIAHHGTRLTRIETWGKAAGAVLGFFQGAILWVLGTHKS